MNRFPRISIVLILKNINNCRKYIKIFEIYQIFSILLYIKQIDKYFNICCSAVCFYYSISLSILCKAIML